MSTAYSFPVSLSHIMYLITILLLAIPCTGRTGAKKGSMSACSRLEAHLGIAVPNMRHIVDAVQILHAIRIIQVAALAPDNVQGLAVVQSGARPDVGLSLRQHLLKWQVMLLQGCRFRLDSTTTYQGGRAMQARLQGLLDLLSNVDMARAVQ